ncbi:MAG: hypothetical protein HC904_10915, partial [Blastochloris sp.]|nr:hypothetical protein [Blastochloris sp.]
LLQRGAASVLAVDVGHGQLAPSLRADPRVESREGLNVRDWLEPELTGAFDFISVDLSFISIKLVLPSILDKAANSASLVILVKPQFEVGREWIGKGGIVKNEQARQAALEGIKVLLSGQGGWKVLGAIDSPVEGKSGNREFLLCAKNPARDGHSEPEKARCTTACDAD